MRNVRIVIKYELYAILRKPSFWLTTFLVPLLVIGTNVGSQLLVRDATSGMTRPAGPPVPGSIPPIAYVDEAGLIQQIPPEVPAGVLQAYPNQEAARAAMASGAIDQYYVFRADLMETGELLLIADKFTALYNSASQETMRYLLAANLVDDPARAAALVEPLWSVETVGLTSEEPEREEGPLTTVVPFATIMIFFFVLTFTGSFMLQSVTREKENRTAEVLLVSLRPHELMLGKILALAVIGLAQMVVWVGGGVLALGKARQVIAMAESFALPAGFFIWGLFYFLLGYLLYGSVMAGLGALAPTAREGSQATFVMVVPLMIPLLANTAFVEAPHGPLATFFSLFPLTSPVSMVTRLAVGGVPWWQPLAGLLLLAVSVYGIVLLAGRLFRADTLLSSSALSWQRVTRELRGER